MTVGGVSFPTSYRCRILSHIRILIIEFLLLLLPVRWTRREEADFYRVVSTFGVIYDTERQRFDWTQFRAFARLDKKTDESLEKYYYSFIAMCKRVCRMQVKTDTGKTSMFYANINS